MGLEMFMLFLVTVPGGHLGKLICINMKQFHLGIIVIKSEEKTFMFSRDIGI